MKKNKFLSNPKSRGILLLLAFTLLVGFTLLFKKIGLIPRGAAGVPSLSYSVEPSPLVAGQNFDLVLKVNPNGASFNAFELYTTYDPTKVEFQNTTNLPQNISSNYLLINQNQSVDTTNNTIAVIGTKTGSPFTGTSDQEIARVTMKVKGGTTGDVVYSWGANTKLGSNITIEKLNGTFTVGGTSGAILSLDSPAVIGGIAQKGQNVDLQVFLKSNNEQVKSTDIILPYDDTRLSFQNTVNLSQNIVIDPNSGFDTQLAIKNVDPTAKKITIGLQTQTPVQSATDILLATIKFVVKLDAPDGLVELLPDFRQSTVYNLQTQNVLSCVGGFRFSVGQVPTVTQGPTATPGGPTDTPVPTVPPGATNTPIPTRTPTPPFAATNTPFPTSPPGATNTPFPTAPPGATNTPIPTRTPTPPFAATNTPTPPPGATRTPTPPFFATSTPFPTAPPGATALNIKIKFQGILSRPNQSNNLPVKVTVSSLAASATNSLTTNFSVDNSGIWSGQALFNNLPTASDYKVFIKGPKHLQKRICESTPKETFPGSYHCEDGTISLAAGNINLDFSGIFLLVGDLPQQDGLVNSYDISLVRNNVGNSDPSVLALADLNLDGIVDSQDYSLVIASLSIRADEGL